MFKTNSEIIKIEAKSQAEIKTGVTFWSHDRGTAKLIFKLIKDGVPQSIPEGTTVPIRLIFKSKTAQDGFGKHDYLATVEDRVNGIISIILEDNILGYIGEVKGSIYLDLPGDRSLDTAGRFNFSIQRSPIDDSTPELEDYYFNGFSQIIDKIEKILADGKLEINQKIAESVTQIDGKLKDTNDKITKANQDVSILNTNIDKANDRIDQTNQQIDDLGKLKKMYSNSIDFGDYDYSGNPNLLSTITSDYFTTKDNVTITNENRGVKLTFRNSGFGAETGNVVQIKPKTTYTLSAKVTVNEDFVGDLSKIRLTYRKFPGGNILLGTNLADMLAGETKMIFVTGSVSEMKQVERTYLRLDSNSQIVDGSINIEYIKLEEASIATPDQPNLFEAPYYLSKVPLGENIANKSVTFPIKTSDYVVYNYKNVDDFIVGEKYVLTIKATKPATQEFNVRNTDNYTFGTMIPMEGLTDIWVLEFTPNTIDDTNPSNLQIYQVPLDTKGSVQIDWLKIEKGDTPTPNIPYYKYRGVNNFVSKNPKDYTWDINNDYIQQVFDDTVSLTKPQTIISSKNFEEVPTVKNQPIHYGPQLFEGWYGSGEEHVGMGTKARLRVGGLVVDGRDQLSEPFTWNSGRYEATVNRDITFYCKGTMFVEIGGNIGKYIYIANWKNSEQTQYASGIPAGVGTNLDGGLYYRNMIDFSWIVQLKQGDKFSIGIELADGKTVNKIQIRTLHIKELVPPTN